VPWIDSRELIPENAALPHGSGSDRELRASDFALIDTGGTLFGYNSDVTRVSLDDGLGLYRYGSDLCG